MNLKWYLVESNTPLNFYILDFMNYKILKSYTKQDTYYFKARAKHDMPKFGILKHDAFTFIINKTIMLHAWSYYMGSICKSEYIKKDLVWDRNNVYDIDITIYKKQSVKALITQFDIIKFTK